MSRSRAVGIDLGTTKSVIAVLNAGVPEVIANAEGARRTPPVVAFAGNGDVLDQGHTAPEIIAQVLRKLERDAAAYLGEDRTDLLIGIAVSAGPEQYRQRQAIEAACRIADLRAFRMIAGPTAAGVAYAHFHGDKEQTILVFDLGGGTFDVSLLEIGDDIVEVRASGGANLGSVDWDQRIVEWLVGKFKSANGIDPTDDKVAMQRLRAAAEQAKIDLSSAHSTSIAVPHICVDADGNQLSLDEQLTRAEFEQMTADLLDRTRAPLQEVLEDADISIDDMDHVLLVGGSTRMPAVIDLVRELTSGKEPNRGVHPEEAAALGAALRAGVGTGEVTDILLLDVTPVSFGIETEGCVMTRMIERNATIPTRQSRTYTTAVDNQLSMQIRVLLGEQTVAADNTRIADFELAGILPAPHGVPRIEVTLDVNSNGIVQVTAKDKGGSEKTVRVGGDALSDHIASGAADSSRLPVCLRREPPQDKSSEPGARSARPEHPAAPAAGPPPGPPRVTTPAQPPPAPARPATPAGPPPGPPRATTPAGPPPGPPRATAPTGLPPGPPQPPGGG